MRDGFGREINYIRISLTDRCNLRCAYCMPGEGGCAGKPEAISGAKTLGRAEAISVAEPLCEAKPISRMKTLSQEEIIRLCRCFAELGITHVRLTGGEPLLRPDLAKIIRDVREIPGIQSVTLTTNGVLLKERLSQLVSAGLSGVNVSLDSLDTARYAKISGANELSGVLKSLEETRNYPDLNVKLNCVPIHGINEEDLPQIALLAKNRDISVRFIELMPIGYGQKFTPVCEAEVKERLENALEIMLRPCPGIFGNGPARYYTAAGFLGKIGFISALSHKFCDTCSRVRLTCDGYLKTCLQYSAGADLRCVLRNGISDADLTALIRRTIREKPRCHHFGESARPACDEHKNMSEIGG